MKTPSLNTLTFNLALHSHTPWREARATLRRGWHATRQPNRRRTALERLHAEHGIPRIN